MEISCFEKDAAVMDARMPPANNRHGDDDDEASPFGGDWAVEAAQEGETAAETVDIGATTSDLFGDNRFATDCVLLVKIAWRIILDFVLEGYCVLCALEGENSMFRIVLRAAKDLPIRFLAAISRIHRQLIRPL
jgi:hypothetical protein